MANRFLEVRLTHSFTQRDLAFEAQVSRHAVMRMEQLCYPNPLPEVINAMSRITGLSEAYLTELYHSAVSENRSATALKYFYDPVAIENITQLVKTYSPTNPSNEHPFVLWRHDVIKYHVEHAVSHRVLSAGQLSQIKFSSLISVHPAILNKYESFGSPFPKAIGDAFKEMLIPDSVINTLSNHPVFNRTVK